MRTPRRLLVVIGLGLVALRAGRSLAAGAIRVRPLDVRDRSWAEATLAAGWGSTQVARQGDLLDAAALPGLVALMGGERVGLLTHRADADGLEIVTIQALREGRGVGQALLDAARAHALAIGLDRIWLSTTDNNLRARALYERWGLRLLHTIPDGVEASRAVKPTIPMVDGHGRPIRDELVYERRLDG